MTLSLHDETMQAKGYPHALRQAASRLDECSRRASDNAKDAIENGYPDDSLAGDERSEIWMAEVYREEARVCADLRVMLLQLADDLASHTKFVGSMKEVVERCLRHCTGRCLRLEDAEAARHAVAALSAVRLSDQGSGEKP